LNGGNYVPWLSGQQIEQDLLISRALVAIFSDDFLSSRLAFRGGTALHKLVLSSQLRYSEDIDLVQIFPEPFGQTFNKLREVLSFMGKPKIKSKHSNSTVIFTADSTEVPVTKLTLKVETNCKEHFSILGIRKAPFGMENSWFSGSCEVTTYALEELIGTKIRALYQRSKGRDLFDLYAALEAEIDTDIALRCYSEYITISNGLVPSKKEYLENLEAKMQDDDFYNDTYKLLRSRLQYDPAVAFNLVKLDLIDKMESNRER
jgi:predicted nucleotidyltransferase component of viral defense system